MEIIKNNLITIIVMIILIYLCLIKNKTNNKNIYVLLRIKNENLDEINKCLNSYRKQKFKNKKLIILNHFDNLNEFVINYCNKYNDGKDQLPMYDNLMNGGCKEYCKSISGAH